VPEVGVDRPGDAPEVHTEVRVEAHVLDGDDRIAEQGGNLAEGHEDAALGLELRQELVVVGVDLGAHAGRVLLERLDGGQVLRPEDVGGDRHTSRADG
jgi:hypothetical protein